MGMKDPRERFTAAAADYDRHRPSYPDALIDWILNQARAHAGTRAADVGCGTGISTRLLAARGLQVTGVDPNADMLAKARAHGGAEYVRGEAASTGLPDKSVSLITVAQAFHWFDIPAALREFRRVLAPGGTCAAFWNDRDESTAFLRDYEALLQKYSAEYRELTARRSTLDELKSADGIGDVREAEFPNLQPMDRDAFLGRVRSSSYVAHGIADKAGFDAELTRLFEREADGGRVAFSYRARAVAFRFP